MSVADSLYDDIRSYLRLTSRVISKVGDQVNISEKFTIRFTVSNTAYPNYVEQPAIVFKNPYIYVEGTEYAEIIPEGPCTKKFPDTLLKPGESSSVDIEFKAKKDIAGWVDIYLTERVARAWIHADLDQNRFFFIRNYIDVNVEIEPLPRH